MTESREINSQDIFDRFKRLEVGKTMTLEMSMVIPSQTDDGVRNESTQPIDVFMDQGKIKIDTGNHRYYTRKARGHQTILVRKVNNPYINW